MTDAFPLPTAAEACARYDAIRARLPAARHPAAPRRAENLAALAEQFDAFVLDGFGVLNLGDAAVPGAAARVAQLRAMGKTVLVLTNGATLPVEGAVAKYARLGMDFAPADVVSSRDALAQALAAWPGAPVWGFAATAQARIEDLAAGALPLGDEPEAYDRAEGFVLLSALDWTPRRQALLSAALAARPRPVLVGNPDLVAPREDGLSLEPGFFAHALADAHGLSPRFYGKPFPEAFRLAAARLPAGIAPARVAMVGDTLHTDILGGAAAGWGTVLVTGWGLMRGLDVPALIARSGITPDWIAPTT